MTTTRARTIMRCVFAVLVAALLATAVVMAETEFLTAAMLAAVAGVGVDVRQTQAIAAAR
ncbi:hypothetical protein [Kocuria rosea]|jgi:hypothetical protein|uniref:hypothetical protein n=1 Tax=Kocuria rosea TaxID=1275 RepID=UPI00203A4160|nr:hypothetical protein [Kocuria rosea]MCM3688308.1 hypothetical protein [Kocuria rosea]